MARNKKKPEFLSALGVMFEIWKAVVDAVLAKGGSDDDLRRIKDDKKLAEAIADLIVGAKKAVIRFVACDSFNSHSTRVKFSWFGDNFKSWFLGKVEEPAKVELPKRHHDLERDSLDAEILADLGGEATAEVTLAGVYALLELQPCGESGELLTNGYANIFYVNCDGGVLRAVDVCWGGGGWLVGAGSVTGPGRWDAGRRVFSR